MLYNDFFYGSLYHNLVNAAPKKCDQPNLTKCMIACVEL